MLQANHVKPKTLSHNLFPVVGVGASAGGLEAFKQLLKAIPENSGIAYILVQHLDPLHESILASILQNFTNIPVLEITDNITVAPDHIYIIPANKILIATDGVLKLEVRPPKPEKNMAIDIFFTSLAEVHQDQAIGVVLSGTGTDGTLGLKAIKDHGGITFVQQPNSAQYDGMPLSAMQSETVDFILTPADIPGKLLELGDTFTYLIKTKDAGYAEKENIYKKILALLKFRHSVDFTYYKQGIIRRHILRRMVLNKIENLAEYLSLLENNLPEQDILYGDFLIPGTSFFRDQGTYHNLCKTIFPAVIKSRSPADALRIWVAGCSAGEEAYSIAICLSEYFVKHTNIKIQLFATDISDNAITKARSGSYLKSELENVSEDRLQQFFHKMNGHYQVKKTLRDMCVFARHDFLKDPPFARMDLIFCRNVLIYMEPYLQKKALAIFHYALKQKGFLQLGKSETISDSSGELFSTKNQQHKLYVRKEARKKFTPFTTGQSEKTLKEMGKGIGKPTIKKEDFQKIADNILLSAYTPVGVVVNDLFDIVQFRGSTGAYLEQPPGKPSLNVIKMAREGLGFELRNLLHKAITAKEPVSKENIPAENGKYMVTIEVIPLLNAFDIHFLILFKNTFETTKKVIPGSEKSDDRANSGPEYFRIQQLENELAHSREDMRLITEYQDAANEELQSANEELLSGSEELQSVNEELETSRDEIQSTFEQLVIVNRELQERNDQYNNERRYSDAIVKTIRQPLLVLTGELRVQRSNNAFHKTFKVTASETEDKLLYELGNRQWNIPALRTRLKNILNDKSFEDFEVTQIFPGIGEKTMLLNASQLIKENSSEQLILLAIEDITEKKALALKEQEFAAILLNERQALHDFFMQTPAFLCILRGPQHIFELANPLYMELTGHRNLLGKPIQEALPELKDQGFVELLDKVYNTGESFIGKEMPFSIDRGKGTPELLHLNLNYKALTNKEGKAEGILIFAYDVSEQIIARRQVEAKAAWLQNMYMSAPAFICTLKGPEYIYELVNPSYQQLFDNRELSGKPIMEALPELKEQGYKDILDKVYNTGEPFVGKEIPVLLSRSKNSELELRYFNFTYHPIHDEIDRINGIMIFGYEVTEEMRGKKTLADIAAERIAVLETIPQCAWTATVNGDITYVNKFFLGYTGMAEADMLMWGWTKVTDPDHADESYKKYNRLIQKGKDFELEFLMKRNRDNAYRWHLLRALAIRDQTGTIISWVGTSTDIDDQVLFAEVLEKQVAERTRSLRISNTELEHSNKNLEQFAYIASHDLQEPLRKIQIFSSMLNDHYTNIPAKAKELINKINASSERMTVLIKDVLNFSKLTLSELIFVKTDLNEILNNILTEFDLMISQKEAIIHKEILPLIEAIPLQMTQLFYNLVSNALKFSSAGRSPVIHISCKILSAEDVKEHAKLNAELNYCELIFKDNGIGFEQKFVDKVFLIFQRLHSRKLYVGTGIGLALCQNIAINHGGKIYAEAKENEGAAFHIFLPVMQTKKTVNETIDNG